MTSFLPFPQNKQFQCAYILTIFPFYSVEDYVDINYSGYEGDNQNEKKKQQKSKTFPRER